MTDRELIREAVNASGLSTRAWAESVAWRSDRTVRRWLAEDSPIPDVVREQCRWFLALDEQQRRRFVSAVTQHPQR